MDRKDRDNNRNEDEVEPSNRSSSWTKIFMKGDKIEYYQEIILRFAFNNKAIRGGHLENRKAYKQFMRDMRKDLELEFGMNFLCICGKQINFAFYVPFEIGFQIKDEDNVVLICWKE